MLDVCFKATEMNKEIIKSIDIVTAGTKNISGNYESE